MRENHSASPRLVRRFSQLIRNEVAGLRHGGPHPEHDITGEVLHQIEESWQHTSFPWPCCNSRPSLCGRILRAMGDEHYCRSSGRYLRSLGDEINNHYEVRRILCETNDNHQEQTQSVITNVNGSTA